MLLETKKELIFFLKNPKQMEEGKKLDLKRIFFQFFIFDLILSFSYGVLNSVLFMVSNDYKEIFSSKITATNPFISRWAIVILLAPILEELAFRLGLKINRKNLSISIALQIIIYLTVLDIINLPLHYRLLLMIFSFSFIYLILNKSILHFFIKNNNTFIYLSILCFGLLHALNFNYGEIQHLLFIPFLISIHLFLGVYLSYVRLKFGFALALIFHVLHNGFFFSLGLLFE